MTNVHISLGRDDGTDQTAAKGVVEWEPTTRREDGTMVILERGFVAPLVDGEATVIVDQSGLTWCWRVTERTDSGGTVRYVSVPAPVLDGLGVEVPAEYVDLPDVDPTTLVPWSPADPEAAYESAVTRIVDDYLTENPPALALDDLTDVNIGDPTEGDVMTLGPLGVWGPATPPSGTLSGVSDGTLATPQTGDAPVFNAVTGKWERVSLPSTYASPRSLWAPYEISRPLDLQDRPTITYSASTIITTPEIFTPKRIGDVATADADMAGETHWRYIGIPDGEVIAFSGATGVTTDDRVTGVNSPWPLVIEFDTSSAQVEIVYRAYATGDSAPQTIWINGVRLQAVTHKAGIGGSGQRSMLLTFPIAWTRRIRIALAGKNINPLYSVRVPSGSTTTRPVVPSRMVAFVGDSFTDGAAAAQWGVSSTSGWPALAADALGVTTPIFAGMGGSGWVKPTTFVSRVPTVLGMSPDAVVFLGGHNDSTYTAAQIEAGVSDAVALCVAASVPAYVIEPVSTATPGWVCDAVRAGALASGAMWIPTGGDLIFGTGTIAAPTGDGNADVFVGDDAIHPTVRGHVWLAREISRRLALAMMG